MGAIDSTPWPVLDTAGLFPGLEDINPVSPASEFQPTAARIKTTQQLTIFLNSQTDSHSVQCLF